MISSIFQVSSVHSKSLLLLIIKASSTFSVQPVPLVKLVPNYKFKIYLCRRVDFLTKNIISCSLSKKSITLSQLTTAIPSPLPFFCDPFEFKGQGSEGMSICSNWKSPKPGRCTRLFTDNEVPRTNPDTFRVPIVFWKEECNMHANHIIHYYREN